VVFGIAREANPWNILASYHAPLWLALSIDLAIALIAIPLLLHATRFTPYRWARIAARLAVWAMCSARIFAALWDTALLISYLII